MSSKGKVVVIGDVMLDRYIRGACERVSPEAPVPVVLVEEEEETFGGAGNVAVNLAMFSPDKDITLVGAVGPSTDSSSRRLHSLSSLYHIDANFYSVLDCTTSKVRVVANGQQVVRFDYDGQLTQPFRSEWVSHATKGAESVILSDYGKGVVSKEVCDAAIWSGARVFVDPKDGDWEKFCGVFCIKPNAHEFKSYVGRNWNEVDLFHVLSEICLSLDIQCVFLTLGKKGAVLYRKSWSALHVIGSRQVDVFDVSGAGDTALAVFAVSQSLGIKKAADVACVAASLVVQKPGTKPVTKPEVDEALK